MMDFDRDFWRVVFTRALGLKGKSGSGRGATINYSKPIRKNGLQSRLNRLSFNWKAREEMYFHLATQISNDATLEAALESYAKRLKKRGRHLHQSMIENVARQLRNGKPLRQSISSLIPPDEVAILDGGDRSGKLAEAIESLISNHDRIDNVVAEYKKALLSPLYNAAIVYVVLWVMGKYAISEIVASVPVSRVHGPARVLYSMTDFAQSPWMAVPPILFLAAVVAIYISLPRWTGKYRIYFDRYFPYAFYRDIEGYKWLSSFCVMLKSGMVDTDIIRIQISSGSPWLKERLINVDRRMSRDGSSLSAALASKKAGMPEFEFPSEYLIDSIESVELYEDFPDRISRISERHANVIEKLARERAKKSGAYANIIIYALIGFIVFAANSLTSQMASISGN